jgi:MoxR-like ATPase
MNDRYETECRFQLASFSKETLEKIKKTMFSLDHEIKLCLIAIVTRGHVLLEGNPGLGKTALVKAFSQSLNLTYGRIQFTPDLMPSDITGTEMPDKNQILKFRRGPIFKTLLLADEINRASPKTQSAMLEAMAERQVTVLGKTYYLPVFFTVLATENPIDHEGTYALPEAQSDRFMFKINLKPQPIEAIELIAEKDAGHLSEVDRSRDEFQLRRHLESLYIENNEDQGESPGSTTDVDTQRKLFAFYMTIRNVGMYPIDVKENALGLLTVAQHMNNIYMASNGQISSANRQMSLKPDQVEWIKKNCIRLQFGLGPRSITALSMAVKAWSVMFPLNLDNPSSVPDAADMANVAKAVLRHRLKLTDLWEDPGGNQAEEFLTQFILNTAPQRNDYKQILEKEIA